MKFFVVVVSDFFFHTISFQALVVVGRHFGVHLLLCPRYLRVFCAEGSAGSCLEISDLNHKNTVFL